MQNVKWGIRIVGEGLAPPVKAPLCKGSWHRHGTAGAMTEGLCSKMLEPGKSNAKS